MNQCEQMWERQFERVCGQYGVAVEIRAVEDPALPRCAVEQREEGFLLRPNRALLSEEEYPDHLAYHIRQILLPRLQLETQRLILRRYRAEDARDCFSFLSDEESAYLDCCSAFAEMDEAYAEFLETFGQQLRYMVVLKETGKVIGTIHLFPDDSRAVETMELGYTIDRAYWRRGYAQEALGALLELLQGQLRQELVTAGTLPENIPSQGLLGKLGFQQEGLRRKAVWHEGLNRAVDLWYFYRDREKTIANRAGL